MARCAAPAFIFAVPRILSLGALLVMTGCSGIVGVAPQAADLQLTTAWDAGASALQDLRPGSEGDGPEVVGVNPDMTPPIVPLSSPIRRIRRLSSREYNNVVRDLLGDNSQPANKFVVDAYQNGYDNGSAGLAVQSDQAVTYQSAAETLAATAVPRNLAVLLGGCDVVKQGAAACADAFINTFAARAYRRPLTTTEAQRLRDVFTAFSGAGGFNAGIQTMLEVVLQSPQFLYREELGPSSAVPAAGAPVTLTDYEVASELSFLLTGSIPDDALWQAAAKGRLKTTADYQAQATRLLGTPGAKETIRSFVHQWLANDWSIDTLTLAVLASHTEPHPKPGFDHRESFSYLGPATLKHPRRDPLAVFNYLFPPVDPNIAKRISVLDAVAGNMGEMRARLGPAEKTKLDYHLTAIGDVERRLKSTLPMCPSPPAAPTNYLAMDPNAELNEDTYIPAMVDNMIDMAVTALRCGMTRIATMQFGYGGGKWEFAWQGIGINCHDLVAHLDTSDAGSTLVNTQRVVLMNQYYASRVARLATALDAIPEGNGTMLDNTLVVWANEQGRGDHNQTNVPVVLIGKAGGAITQGGKVIDTGPQVFNRLGCTILNAMGHPAAGFGDVANCGSFQGLV